VYHRARYMATYKENAMLRELDIDEMDQVSGGTDGTGQAPDPNNPTFWDNFDGLGFMQGDGDLHDESALGLGIVGVVGLGIAAVASAPLVLIGATAVGVGALVGAGIATYTDPSNNSSVSNDGSDSEGDSDSNDD